MANANGAMPLMLKVIRAIAQVHGWADWQAPTQAQLLARAKNTPLFVRGNFNDWGLTAPMQRLPRDRFVATVMAPAGRLEFKLAAADWAVLDLGLATDRASVATFLPLTVAGSNVLFDVKTAGPVQVEMDMRHPSGPRVQVRIQKPSDAPRTPRL
jgi:hypothetical protein